ncbi:RnfABCDGE-type electron transport complex D subunit [Petrotoga sibirica]|uniref:RnfABCDGE-type electron transport complex D subunit n=2 Tax=Petrotoga sibirica TaxID=156202 RepID=A0A4R8EUE5_9BACT|nr:MULTISPECIES: RnfABCDGE type electron transport complex subunit D [Petrotoga]TDX16210.1 RnfABCDGE-type electron transport complex D subunit [Petrotoga sibirica]
MASGFFQKQVMMRKVLYSLIPIYTFAFYMYGWRLIFLSIFVYGFGILTEYIMERRQKRKVTEAVLVSCTLFVLSLPPATPWWIASIGIIFGVLFAKEVYGGFGRNVFNPAIAGRLFIYITFPNIMTQSWLQPGNFGRATSDILTSATPLQVLANGENFGLFELFFGLRSGSMGEGPIFLILIAAIYLIATKTASWKIMLSTFLSASLLTIFFSLMGLQNAFYPLEFLLSGSFMFVTVFMATDPVTAPKNETSKWFYGIIIGVTAIFIRTFSLFPEGTSFGVLMGNTFAALLDIAFTRKKVKA